MRPASALRIHHQDTKIAQRRTGNLALAAANGMGVDQNVIRTPANAPIGAAGLYDRGLVAFGAGARNIVQTGFAPQLQKVMRTPPNPATGAAML